MNDTWAKFLRYGHFREFLLLLERMINLGLIDLKLGSYIKVNVNDGTSIAQNRPDANFGQEH